MSARPNEGSRTSLAELAALFLKLGAIAFGGPAAHIAMMEDVVLALASAWLLIRFRINSAWLVAGGALIGAMAHP